MPTSSKWVAGAVTLALASLIAFHSSRAQSDTAWSEIFVKDLNAARQRIANAHPGVVDAKNPAFAKTLETAYREALDAAPRVKDYNAYRMLLMRFGNRFQDRHLNVGADRAFQNARSAGIYPVYRDGRFVVAEVDSRYGVRAAAIRGAAVRACDRVPAKDFFAERVLSWRGRPSIEADWYMYAPLYLFHYSDVLGAAPTSCTFEKNGVNTTVTLDWQSFEPGAVNAVLGRLTGFDARPLSLERLDDGRKLWVNLPTFAVNDSASIASMRALIDTLRVELARNKRWDLLVFDLRGNSGGSSTWGDEIMQALFGQAYAQAARAYLDDGVFTEWRVSAENIEALDGIIKQQIDRHGADHPDVQRTRQFRDSMAAALARGEKLLPTGSGQRSGVRPPAPVALPGRVVALTSAQCFSACLDFLDRIKLHPAVIQVGEPTGVDTDYMENWGTSLPSGIARIGHPMKVYRNRHRANNQSYPPDVLYTAGLHDTNAVRQWVLDNYARWRK